MVLRKAKVLDPEKSKLYRPIYFSLNALEEMYLLNTLQDAKAS